MNTTPNPDLDRLLREAMRPEPDDLAVPPSFAAETVTRATQTRPRRRAVYAVAVPLLAAAVAAAIVVVAVRESDTTPAPAEKPTEELVDGAVPLSRWLENRTLGRLSADPSKPAAAGTSMYRACDADGECAVTLVSPSGREIDLADVSPTLAERLADDGLDGAALSPTGHWLGMPHDGGYRIHHLDRPRATVTVPASPDGDRWELVGWSEQSWAPTLALYDGDRLVRFANWDNLTRDRVKYLDVPAAVATTPQLGHRPYESPVMSPYEEVDGQLPRVASTAPPTNEWFVVSPLGSDRPGSVIGSSKYGGDGQSFESCVGPDETLAGPDGRIHRWETRGTRSVHADAVTVATAVFSRDLSRTEPVAVILWGCAPRGESAWGEEIPDGGRLDLPTSTDDETWTFLGMLPYGEVALAHTADGVPTYTRLTADGELDPMYEFPADAEVLTPGGVVGD